MMFAGRLRIAAAVLVAASSVSTAAYATDASLTASSSDQSAVSATGESYGMVANRQIINGLGLIKSPVTADASLKAAVTTQSLPSTAIVVGDIVLARTYDGAKFVAAKWNSLNYSWSTAQMSCLDTLWSRESHWNFQSRNRRSGAYGIPQANPGNKMASAGKDWRTNPITQIKWGMSYINARYGNPCSALQRSNRYGWY